LSDFLLVKRTNTTKFSLFRTVIQLSHEQLNFKAYFSVICLVVLAVNSDIVPWPTSSSGFTWPDANTVVTG